MRRPKYMSPSSIATWKKSQEEYYLKYLTDNRPPRDPQTVPMAIGSSFDAYIKADLHKRLINNGDPKFDLVTLFEAQVETQNRDRAWKDGEIAYKKYIAHGGLTELLLEMKDALTEPRFEIEVESILNYNGRYVAFLGKPDVFFINKQTARVTLDFKVNGFYSTSKTYPKTGYVRILPGRAPHKDCIAMMHNGIMVNHYKSLEHLDETWAAQLSIYSWLCGSGIGDRWIAGIEQLVGKPEDLKIAQHRLFCGSEFQIKLFNDAADIWEIINSDHIFRDQTLETSQARCAVLDERATQIANMSDAERALMPPARSF